MWLMRGCWKGCFNYTYMKKLLIIVFFFTSKAASPQSSFITDYLLDSLQYHTSANIKATPDSGFIVIMKIGGNSGSFGPLLIKFDKQGKKLWSKFFNRLSSSVCDVLPLKDNLFFTGYTGDDKFQLLKLDINGNLIWRKLYWCDPGQGSKQGFSLHTIDNNNILIQGVHEIPPIGDPQITVIKVNTDGGIGWGKKYNYTYTYSRAISLKNQSIVVQSKDGLMNIDTTGNVNWIFKPNLSTLLSNAVGTNDGILFTTYLNGDTNIVYKVSHSGTPQWASPKIKIKVHNIIENNGYSIACGGYYENGKNRSISLVELDNNGNIKRQTIFSPDSTLVSARIVKTADNKFVILGAFPNKLRIIISDDPFNNCDNISIPSNTSTLNLTLTPSSVSAIPISIYSFQDTAISMDYSVEKKFIQCCPFPDAGFSASALSGEAPLEVAFYASKNNFLCKWDFDDGSNSIAVNTTHSFEKKGNYYVKLVCQTGDCIDSSMVEVNVKDPAFTPNIFTPNGDGTNDVFTISNLPEGSSFEVYNRWGVKQYVSTPLNNSAVNNNSWDGRTTSGQECPEGVYYYIATLSDKTIKGFVHLLR